jgi:hypothetical protein
MSLEDGCQIWNLDEPFSGLQVRCQVLKKCNGKKKHFANHFGERPGCKIRQQD